MALKALAFKAFGFVQYVLINVFSIGTDASSDAADFFEEISTSTGGSYASVDDASKVGDAIIDSIEQIEVAEKITVNADFGSAMAHQKINLYSGKKYLFTIEADENGQFVIDSIEADTYRWTSNSLYSGGSIDIDTDSRDATIRMTKDYWFTPLLQLWYQHTYLICIALLAYIVACVAAPSSVKKIRVRVQKKKASVTTVTVPASIAEQPQRPESVPVLEDHISDEDNLLCPSCGFKVTSADRFCKLCGFDLHNAQAKETERVCKNCGHRCKENEMYCGKCGTKIEKE